jgi:micrococcal nuclease
MSELIFGKDAKIRPQAIDRSGRVVARVLVDNQDAGLELLKQGLCCVYDKYIGQARIDIEAGYRAARAAAQSDKLGLWQDPDPVPPWKWRISVRATHLARGVFSCTVG